MENVNPNATIGLYVATFHLVHILTAFGALDFSNFLGLVAAFTTAHVSCAADTIREVPTGSRNVHPS